MPSRAQHFKKPRQLVGPHRLAVLAKGSRAVARVEIQRGHDHKIEAMTGGAEMLVAT